MNCCTLYTEKYRLMAQKVLIFMGHELPDSAHVLKPPYETPLLEKKKFCSYSISFKDSYSKKFCLHKVL